MNCRTASCGSNVVVLLILASLIGAVSSVFVYPGSGDCATKKPICTDPSLKFSTGNGRGSSNESGIPINPRTGGYACMYVTEHNSSWYSLYVNESGHLEFYIVSDTGVDLDYVLWGPFSDPAFGCGSNLTQNWDETAEIRCGYRRGPSTLNFLDANPQSLERVNATYVQAGQWYTLLINDDDDPGSRNISSFYIIPTKFNTAKTDCSFFTGATSYQVMSPNPTLGEQFTIEITGYQLDSQRNHDLARAVRDGSDCSQAEEGADRDGFDLEPGDASGLTLTRWSPTFLFSGWFRLCYRPWNRTFQMMSPPFFVNDTRVELPYGSRVGIPDIPETMGLDWIDFEPRQVRAGEAAHYHFSGFRAFAYNTMDQTCNTPGIWAKIVLRNCSELTQPQRLGADHNASFALEKVGKYKMCVKHRLDWEEVSGWLTVTTPDNSVAFFGYESCEQMLLHAPARQNNWCGCFYNGSATKSASIAPVILPMNFPLDVIINSNAISEVDQGCCQYKRRSQVCCKQPGVAGANWGWCTNP